MTHLVFYNTIFGCNLDLIVRQSEILNIVGIQKDHYE